MHDEWEYDFTNPPRVPPPTYCDNCGNQLPLADAFVVTKQQGYFDDVLVYHFCDELCANHFYLERLRAGL